MLAISEKWTLDLVEKLHSVLKGESEADQAALQEITEAIKKKRPSPE